MKILLKLAYDGTNYSGWQRQLNAPSVQEAVEEAVTVVFNKAVTVTGASRTDAGVHALSQMVMLDVEDLVFPIDKLPVVLNGKLPPDITVLDASVAEDSFHPRFDAKEKTYAYKILNAPYPNPLQRNFTCFVSYALDVEQMRKAASCFVGEHDFTAFCATGGRVVDKVRSIYACGVECAEAAPFGRVITITVRGNGFLYNMVRIMAGTILYVGMGKIKPEAIIDIITSGDRKRAGKTLPPQGLTLMDIKY